MWAQWLSSFPDVAVLPLDVGGAAREDRRLPAIPWLAQRLLSDDERVLLDALADMTSRGVVCGPLHQQPWGALTQIVLPGGGKLGVYQPRHARPEPMQ